MSNLTITSVLLTRFLLLFTLLHSHKQCWDRDWLPGPGLASTIDLQNKLTLLASRRGMLREYQQINDNSIPRVLLRILQFIQKRS